MRSKNILIVLVGVIVVFVYSSCNSGGGGSSGGDTLTSLFKSAFPEEAAVSSPTAKKSGSSIVLTNQSGDIVLMADASDTADKKKEALTAVLDASNCAVSINLQSSGNANCYGPTMTFSGHPDGGSPTSLPGGDLGIWDAAETSGEACASAQMNNRMKGVASQLDAAFFSVAAMMCAAKNAGQAVPANPGESIEVTTAVNGKITLNGQPTTVTSAKLAREANSGGKPVYVSSITATFGSKTATIRLKHIPAGVQDETTFTGKVSVSLADSTRESGFDGNCTGSSSGMVDAVSIVYEKNAAGNMKYALKSANFCGSSANPFVSATNYSVDLTKTYSSNNGGWGNNANVLLADYTPSTGVGTYQYAWQAGRNDSHSRVLNVKISDSTNAVAYFGFGPAASATSSVGSISTMICNWAGPNSSHTGVSKVQKQVMSRASTMFTPTTSSITYDPVNSCESSSNSFTITASGHSAVTADTTTTNLVNLTDWSATISNVTAPAEVD